jgi:hypothetical protein
MHVFLVGVLVGVGLFGMCVALVLLFRLNTELTVVKNTLQLIWTKLTKIEKMSEVTMAASENFVNALQQSAENMMFVRSDRPTRPPTDDFHDLRETFEDGIRNLEEEGDEGDEDEENWKKNK